MKPRVLIINSYGGSLVKAVTDENHPVIASMEDKSYGIETQKLNFPGLTYYDTFNDWPIDLDLRGAAVIAHPPCAGFSTQNRSKAVNKRGALSGAFACTLRLLEYTMPREPSVIALESVPQAMEGARYIHDHLAEYYGYNAYRIMQNAASFGVPQWRRRFWIIFVKKSLGLKPEFHIDVNHNFVHVGDVLDPNVGDTTCHSSQTKRMQLQFERFKKLGLTPEDQDKILAGPDYGYGGLLRVLSNWKGLPRGWKNREAFVHETIVGSHFTSGSLHTLNPNGFAPVLLASAWWWFGKRMIGYDDYKVLMGFPATYQYHKERMTLELLSRGVCPPVARWIIRLMDRNVFGLDVPEPAGNGYEQHITILPGELADVTPPKKLKGAVA